MSVAVLHMPGTALPAMRWEQSRTAQEQAKLWGLAGTELARWERIVRGAGVERRCAVVEPGEAMPLSTAQRMERFAQHAPPLAHAAARDALANAGVQAQEVTDLVVVSCTGFRSPGVGHELAVRLGLDPGVRHSQIGFMGCFGGVCGARAAAAVAGADPQAVVLLVCIELCSLHMRADRTPQNLVACALFADGAAAAVVTQRPRAQGAVARLDLGRSRVLPGTGDAMTWTITDLGFAMTLAREVPGALEGCIGGVVAGDAALVVHPGGAGIVDAVEAGTRVLAPPPDARSYEASRAVLREHGNMSSGSVFFVLRELLARGVPVGAPGYRARMVAFGPGLTVDSVGLLPLAGVP